MVRIMQPLNQGVPEAAGFRTRNAGFTLLELMIVVTIVGILAVIVIPSYLNYAVRAKVSEGFSLASTAKAAVAQHYAVSGQLPTNNAEAGLSAAESFTGKYVQSVLVLEDGSIQTTYTVRPIEGETLTLTPNITSDTSVRWCCSSSLPINYLPRSCRETAEQCDAGGSSGSGDGLD